MKRWPIPFAIILPLAELFVAALILAVPAALVYLKLVNLAHGKGVAHLGSGQSRETIPQTDFLSFATLVASTETSHTLTALNMPGMFGEVLVSLPTTWPESWHPAEISLESWRSIIMPAFCLPAWLLVGCGVDALLGWRKLHWGLLLTGTLLCALFLVLLTGLGIMYLTSDHDDSTFVVGGFSLWALLFATVPAAWIRQGRDRRASAKQTKSVDPA
jgi:hypothetical protein